MIQNPTPEQRAQRILEAFRADFHDGNPMWLYRNIQREIEDAVAKTVLLKSTEEKPRYAVGVSVLLTSGGRLLLGRRKNNKAAGWLSTPGGRLEPNESIMECARREFFEETGAQLADRVDLSAEFNDNRITPRILTAARHNRFDDNYVMIYVHATGWQGTITNPEPDKCEGWNWYAGYDLAGRQDVTEPKEVLDLLPLNRTRDAVAQARIDGYNQAIGDLTKKNILDLDAAQLLIKL